ncbi:MAG: sigma-70 family RNA polymerase sigma factor [Planctomycetota bacterium]|nr:MAG: sigma-70 family RNA polymerase sigma factor [Planctomycetota bacterium]
MIRDNATWVAQLRARHEPAVADLREALVGNLRRALVDRPAANDALQEDAVQEALLRILDRLDQFAGRSQFLTWATSIAIHMALGQLRRRRWSDVSLEEIASQAHLPQHIDNAAAAPDDLAHRQALLSALAQAIETELTERQRTALLAELKGMPQDEIARQLGSNRNAVYKLTHDARKKLKRRLEAAGYSAADVAPASIS